MAFSLTIQWHSLIVRGIMKNFAGLTRFTRAMPGHYLPAPFLKRLRPLPPPYIPRPNGLSHPSTTGGSASD